MKLYQTYLSPFPTRVRLVIYAKGLNVEIIEPSGFHGSTDGKGEYLDVNPIGRVPALVLDDGRALPESETICEYLEDQFPEPSLRPEDPFDLAQVRLLTRISDIYIVMAMVPLFNQAGLPGKARSNEVINAAMGEIEKSLAFLEEYIGKDGYAFGSSLTQADGALIPILMLITEWAPRLFRVEDLLEKFPKTKAYWQAIQHDDIAKRVIAETRDAVAQRQVKREDDGMS